MNQKLLLRDTLLVAPVFLFGAIWLVLALVFRVDFAPGADYGASMLWNLIFPLMFIGLWQMAYGVVLIVDIAWSKQLSIGKKVLYSVLVWLAVQGAFVIVYIARVLWLLGRKNRMPGDAAGKGGA